MVRGLRSDRRRQVPQFRGHVGRLRHADHHLTLIAVVDDRHELRNFHRPRQLVVAKARVEHHAHLAVHHAAFVKGHAHGLDHAAVDLAFERDAVEGQPAVLHVAHFDDAHLAGLDVDFDLGERDAVDAASRQPRLPLPARREPARWKRGAGLFPRQRFAVAGDLSFVEEQCIGLRAEERGDALGHFHPRVVGGVFDRRRQRGGGGRAAGGVGVAVG